MSFAGRLKISRKEKGYSQEALAEELEVSRQSITKWETGTAFPELKKLLQLSVKLDKDLDWLLCDERNSLIIDRAHEQIHLVDVQRIYDKKSLEGAVRDRRIRGILESLDGTEFIEQVDEEDFRGERTYTVFGVRMYAASHGINPKTGESVELFDELSPEETVDMLIRYAQGIRDLNKSLFIGSIQCYFR